MGSKPTFGRGIHHPKEVILRYKLNATPSLRSSRAKGNALLLSSTAERKKPSLESPTSCFPSGSQKEAKKGEVPLKLPSTTLMIKDCDAIVAKKRKG